jgi:hypothetical protein
MRGDNCADASSDDAGLKPRRYKCRWLDCVTNLVSFRCGDR